ncbi:MAG: ATP-binding response regulator [Candidatus Hodarchaeales archaeon]|jgi:CheY-like chemotaxis protein
MPCVLLIDDDKDLLMIAKAYLQKTEPTLRVMTTQFPQEALRLLEMENFDVVFSDYQMPNLDGLKLLEKLRNDGNSIPFIIFAGRGREEVAMQALNLVENAVIHGKPNSIRVRYQIAREGGVILITNDGTPIPKENQEKIFNHGFTTKTGRGLGLTIVRKVIEAHGWQIHLDATPQTTFRIVLPADK